MVTVMRLLYSVLRVSNGMPSDSTVTKLRDDHDSNHKGRESLMAKAMAHLVVVGNIFNQIR